MVILRVILFSGLVAHKMLWEVLKRGDRAGSAGEPVSSTLIQRLIKLAKIGVLAGVAVQTLFLSLFPITQHPMLLRVVGTAIYALGLATAVTGRLQLGKNWIDLEDYRVLSDQALVTNGIYRYIRHPIYTGDVLLLLGLELALNSWLVLGVSIPLLVTVKQALAEETLLERAYPEYSAYRQRTKRFIPFVV